MPVWCLRAAEFGGARAFGFGSDWLLSSNCFQSRTRRARGEARRSPDCAMPRRVKPPSFVISERGKQLFYDLIELS